MNLKIKITLETNRLLLLHKHTVTKVWCAECESETHFVAENEISEFLPKKESNLKPHKVLTPNGLVLVCLESLLKLEE